MPYETIVLDTWGDERIARITLNRPDRLNAINSTMLEELADAVERVANDDRVRVVVLTGAGRAFCSGADVSGMAGGGGPHDSPSAEELRRGFRYPQRIMLGIHRMEKPVIGMINGLAAGAGFDLACACDLRVGCPDSRFMVAFVRIGLFPGYGGTWLYPRALGSIPKAAELLFTGDWLEAEEAFRFGLLNRLVPKERLEEETLALATRIAEGPPIAIRLAKMMLYRGLEVDLETAMLMAAAAETITLTSEDHREGVAAFREKRKPVYKGR
ncbi:MAG: enoyl-CoA hydratase [Dehalococcoidia bacterium]|nr:enoyl-CoA hydratase [Dehalococcoidia bacterium]MDW8119127.1 enoyl-CoA hydratase [Chloroflexota bacterium]